MPSSEMMPTSEILRLAATLGGLAVLIVLGALLLRHRLRWENARWRRVNDEQAPPQQ